ncbi:hypothetical protein CYMTET_35741 [Cymbomonas tetramitiformis]|uniref:Uncharacterized protein n=1 Tax=Cymbomonas tetramitiformis TaxID=36881 RepID=A0AAE0F8N6_9CHLO|nr:hypothetical protein CYMTET_35741 [Cymbomonas tetramitiformis]|eukprot:gene175-310_t
MAQVAFAWYIMSEFYDIKDKIDDCSVTPSEDKTYKTSDQGDVALTVSIVCGVLLTLALMLLGLILATPTAIPDKIKEYLQKITGMLGYAALVMTAILFGIHVAGYPYETLEDLYKLLETTSTSVKFVDCGKPEKEVSLTVVLYIQLFLFAFNNLLGAFAGSKEKESAP